MAQPHIKQDPYIKKDPGVMGSPASFNDVDALEDAGDLEFRDNDPRFRAVYLARVPKYVWEQWENIGEDEEIDLGTLRQSWTFAPDGTKKESLSMLLNDIPQHKPIPKEYNLNVTDTNVKNTFFFTEQDLPGFKTRSKRGFDEKTANLPARLLRPKVEKTEDHAPPDPKKRFQPYFRRAIPKKTTLVGGITVELNCTPVNNPETNRILAERTHLAMMPKRQSVHVKGNVKGFFQPGTIMAQNSFGGFIKNTTAEKKARSLESKTARIPRNELMDLLFKCFREYRFWSMKALRAKLRQPEAYLRELLDEIADMPKSGRFAMKWTLKEAYAKANAIGENEAPDAGEDVDLDMADDDDDEDVNFEDV